MSASSPDHESARETITLPSRIETIARCLILHGSHVLLCRDLKGGYSYLPGGHVEPGETAMDAVQRELLEETGASIGAGEVLLVAEHLFVQRGKPKHEINMVFHVEHRLEADKPVPSLESHIEFWWADLASLPEVDLRPEFMRAWLMTEDAQRDAGNRPLWLSIQTVDS